MFGLLAEKFGGLLRDTVETVNDVIEEVGTIPEKFMEGYEKGLMTTPNNEVSDTKSEDTKSTNNGPVMSPFVPRSNS